MQPQHERAAGMNPMPHPAGSVECDQAIFTSIPGPMGSGYRLVSASRALTQADRSTITRYSPSHDGLCDASPEALGLTFYRLSADRLCLGFTCCAGHEHTARGGQRVYTRCIVLNADRFAAFGFNPFNVLRAFVETGGAEPDLHPARELPRILLNPIQVIEAAPLSAAVADTGRDWLCCTLHEVLAKNRTIFVEPTSSWSLVEALLLAVPGPLRADLSFSVGLRYSPSRKFDLNVVAEPAGKLEVRLRGHAVQLLIPQGRRRPAFPESNWLRMAGTWWTAGLWDRLNSLTSRAQIDPSPQARETYGKLCLTRDALAGQDRCGLLGALQDNVGESPSDPVAAELTMALVSEAATRLADAYSTAQLNELTADWDAVVDIWQRGSSMAGLLAVMLRRLTRLSILEATFRGLRCADRLDAALAADPVYSALEDMLDHLGEWIFDAPPEELESLSETLKMWPANGAMTDRVTEITRQLETQLSAEPA